MNRCGFVHMQTEEMAESAIKALNNSQFNGGVISVEPGRMKERSGYGPKKVGQGGGVVGGGRNFNNNNSGGDQRNRSNDRQGGRFGGGGGGGPGGGMGGNNRRNGNLGPMRRDRGGFQNRGAPYGKGRDNFDRMDGGGMNMNNRGGPMDRKYIFRL